MASDDIRWRQRFMNFQKALGQLQRFVDKDELSDLEVQGLVKAFEYTYELAWNVLKDFLEYQGHTDLFGSRDTIRRAFRVGLIEDGDSWMDMLGSRNRTSHTYNEETAKEIQEAVLKTYYPLFRRLQVRLQTLPGE
ncbi:MAG: nucleotidyltransferase substrate binding protein [Thermodesulfobacteriota bacterium]